MIEIDIPGGRILALEHIVLDYNGTLACDGILLSGVAECLTNLASDLQVHVLTADTFGKAKAGLEGIPCKLTILPAGSQDQGKLDYVNVLGAESCVCVGNGRNDRLMLKAAGLGIAVILDEGASMETLASADIVCRDIVSALELPSNPLRVKATLRS